MPPPLLAVWQVVGGVSLLDLSDYSHCQFWEERGVGYVGDGASEFCDAVHIESPVDDRVDSFIDFVLEERFVWLDSGAAADGEPFEFPIAPDGYHKDDISGGPPYGLVPGERDSGPSRYELSSGGAEL